MGNILIQFVNKMISLIGSAVTAVLSLLPSSPFTFVQSIDSEWLNAINWIFPVGTIVSHLEAFCLAVVVYYGLRVLLRWVKAAGN